MTFWTMWQSLRSRWLHNSRLGYRLQTELAIEHVQISLCRDDKYVVGLDDQAFRDQLNRHVCVARQNLVEMSGYGSQVIHDDDRNTHIRGQVTK